jgi:ribonucleoside-diphosphate reductase alpha chain
MTEVVEGGSTGEAGSVKGAGKSGDAAKHSVASSAKATGKAGPVYPANGLVVERVYTTAGVHPFDELDWERRDVVMTNWRDGSVNFEQRGVEFPTSWSVNAANIVTTKYFRGRHQPAGMVAQAADQPGGADLPHRR